MTKTSNQSLQSLAGAMTQHFDLNRMPESRVTRLGSRHHLWNARRNMHTNNTFKLPKYRVVGQFEI
jgi:hypothetical protein